MIEIFINECSLHEQLPNGSEFTLIFRKFFTMLNIFNQRKTAHMLYQHENLFTMYRITEAEALIASLNKLPDKSLSTGIKGLLFNKLNAKYWQTTRKHSSDDVFICLEDIVTDTSMAELAERKLQNSALTGLLVNFPRSKFAQLTTVEISKNDVALLELDCLDDQDILSHWLDDKLQAKRFEYDYYSTTKPTDEQTVLRDKQRFAPTLHIEQGRRVFKEIKTGYYWYVDNLHSGQRSHLEVFDSERQHLGEANLDGVIDLNKRKPGREITL